MSAISVPGPVLALVSAWVFVLGVFVLWMFAIARASYWRDAAERAHYERRRLELRRELIVAQMEEQRRRRAAHYAQMSEDARAVLAETFVDWVDQERGSWS